MVQFETHKIKHKWRMVLAAIPVQRSGGMRRKQPAIKDWEKTNLFLRSILVFSFHSFAKLFLL